MHIRPCRAMRTLEGHARGTGVYAEDETINNNTLNSFKKEIMFSIRNKNLYFKVFILLFYFNNLFSQPSESFKHFQIVDKKLGTVEYHLTKKKINEEKPLLIWLDGSGCEPILTIIKDSLGKAAYKSTIFINIDKLSEHYHVVVISKPGVPFSREIHEGDTENIMGKDCGQTYNNNLSLNWRANAVSKVIDDVLKKNKIKNKKIVVAGHSEGSHVAVKAATINRKITHIGCFSGGGLTQYFLSILENRKLAFAGVISPDTAQANINSIIEVVKDISSNPNDTEKFWKGHTYKRWASFGNEPFIDNLLSLKIPIYIVNGTADENSPSESLDILPIIFAQHKKNNLTFKTCVDCDHWFRIEVEGKKIKQKDVIFKEFFDWLENPNI